MLNDFRKITMSVLLNAIKFNYRMDNIYGGSAIGIFLWLYQNIEMD